MESSTCWWCFFAGRLLSCAGEKLELSDNCIRKAALYGHIFLSATHYFWVDSSMLNGIYFKFDTISDLSPRSSVHKDYKPQLIVPQIEHHRLLALKVDSSKVESWHPLFLVPFFSFEMYTSLSMSINTIFMLSLKLGQLIPAMQILP